MKAVLQFAKEYAGLRKMEFIYFMVNIHTPKKKWLDNTIWPDCMYKHIYVHNIKNYHHAYISMKESEVHATWHFVFSCSLEAGKGYQL